MDSQYLADDVIMQMHKAKLDVCCDDDFGPQLIDVRICSPLAGEQAQSIAAAKRDGAAAQRQANVNILMYGDSATSSRPEGDHQRKPETG